MSLSLLGQYGLFALIFYAICVIIVATVIYEERDPSTTLAWALVFFAFPVVGFVLYVLFGRNLRSKRRNRLTRLAEEAGRSMLRPVYSSFSDGAASLVGEPHSLTNRLVRAITTLSHTEPLPCVGLEVLVTGEHKFSRLFDDISDANDHVHLEYFIWGEDALTGRFCDLLTEKIASGVEVRILYDWIGSLPYRKSQLKRLRAAGAFVHADAADIQRLNYRNHRKIAVIDGRVGFTGGMNFGRDYVDGGNRYDSWRDTSIRFGGPLVADLQRLFAARWLRITDEDLFNERYFPAELSEGLPQDHVWGQIVHSSAESRWESIRQSFLIAIGAAEKSVRIQSPYFVPDQGILDTLVSQSFGGVDVEFMMAGVPDKRLPWWAAFSYIDDLVEAGGALYQYEEGFFHPKTMTIDGEIAVMGTANFDIRSFSLHDELSIFFFDRRVAAAQDAMFDADMDSCKNVTLAEVSALSAPVRFRNALARLGSRLM